MFNPELYLPKTPQKNDGILIDPPISDAIPIRLPAEAIRAEFPPVDPPKYQK
jgi:hypothetical protein